MLNLQDTIIRFIGNNFEFVVEKNWPDDIIIPYTLSEKLFHFLIETGEINESRLKYFTSDKCQLWRVKLNIENYENPSSLNFLMGHPLRLLKIFNIEHNLFDIIYEHVKDKDLQELSLCHGKFNNPNVPSSTSTTRISQLTVFKSLIKLNLSFTDLTEDGLALLCGELKLIENLNISGTLIFQLTCLSELKNLRILKFEDKPRTFHPSNLLHLITMTKLKEIYLYDYTPSLYHNDVLTIQELLNSSHWTDLEYFSIFLNPKVEFDVIE